MKLIRSTVVKTAVFAAVLLAATAVQVQSLPLAPQPSESAVREAMIRSLQKLSLSDQINDFIRAAESWGFKLVVAPDPVELIVNDGSTSLHLRLEYGNQYVFAARCGSECSHLRLELKDASGNVVMKSDNPNGKPAFIFSPPDQKSTGEYALNLELTGCRTVRCQVGRVVLAQPDNRPKLWWDVFKGIAI